MPILRKIKRKENGVEETVHLGALAQNITQDATHRFVTDTEKQAWNSKPGSTSGLDNNVVTFTEAATRENLQSGEKLSISLGKIKKWFSDLGAAAFMAVANNCTTTQPGSVLAAEQGKKLQDQISQVSSEFFAQNWVPSNGYDPFGATALLQVFSVNEGSQIAQGVPPGLSPYATVICFGKAEYRVLWYVDVFGATATYSTNQNRWIVPTSAKTLLRANVTGSGSIDVKSVLPNWANLSVDDFIFNTTHIALNMSGWGHPSNKQPDPANADFYPIEKSYSNGVLTYNIKPTSISVGQYGQVAGATTNITPYCDIYA